MASSEVGPNLGAVVPSPEAHTLLMTSAEAREKRRAIKLGRLPVKMSITKRGRRRLEMPDQGMMPVFESLTGQELNNLQLAYYRNGEPLFDQFTQGYRVEPEKININWYVSGSRTQAIKNTQRLKAAQSEAERKEIKAAMERQTQHRSDQFCKEVHTNSYTAKLRATSLRTTLALIEAGRPLDPTAATFAADAIYDFGFAVTYNKGSLGLRNNFGYRISYIGEKAFDNLELLRDNIGLMKEVVLHEQERRVAYWEPRAQAALRWLGQQDRFTPDIREAQAEVEAEIDRQAAIRDNIVSDES